jgi:hypothetical protein
MRWSTRDMRWSTSAPPLRGIAAGARLVIDACFGEQ